MVTPGRTYTYGSGYRYGFNGKENDNEVKGDGNQQDYGMRVYDPRLGRFLSVDPLTKDYPWYTPYQFAGNTPIQAIDIDGLEEYVITTELYKSGKPKSMLIQYTVDNDLKQKVNMKFRTLLGKNPDGTDRLGEYRTNEKIIRITKSSDGKIASTTGNNLTKQETAILKAKSRTDKEVGNSWQLSIGAEKYASEINRDPNSMIDKIAYQHFNLIEKSTFDVGRAGVYLGTTPTIAGMPNGTIAWSGVSSEIKSLPSLIKEDAGIKGVDISIVLPVSSSLDASQAAEMRRGVEHYGEELKAFMLKSGLNASQINLKIFTPNYTDDTPHDERGAATSNTAPSMPKGGTTINLKR